MADLRAQGSAVDSCVAVFYPDTRTAYSATFSDIVAGIGEPYRWRVEAVSVDEGEGETGAPPVAEPPCPMQIGLGRVGVNHLRPRALQRPTVFGAIQAPLGERAEVATISLIPEPQQVLLRLRHFAPTIRNVHLIFNPRRSEAFVALASAAAKRQRLNLIAYESSELKASLQLYRQLFSALDPQRDAVWLIGGDAASQTSAVMPVVLKRAWQRNIVVFSSQPAHAKRGVLFSIYPDYRALGRQLAELLSRCARQPRLCRDRAVIPLTALKTAINTKTASRLKLNLDYEHDPYIDLAFPEKLP